MSKSCSPDVQPFQRNQQQFLARGNAASSCIKARRLISAVWPLYGNQSLAVLDISGRGRHRRYCVRWIVDINAPAPQCR
jgi:hypothetical protein